MKVKFSVDIEIPEYEVDQFVTSPFRDQSLPLQESLIKEIKSVLDIAGMDYGWEITPGKVEFIE